MKLMSRLPLLKEPTKGRYKRMQTARVATWVVSLRRSPQTLKAHELTVLMPYDMVS